MDAYDMKHPIAIMSNRYPQIMLSIKQNMSQSELYKKVVQLGQPMPNELVDYDFSCSDRDFIQEEAFTCGKITVLFLYDRKDFENFIRKTAYRCEPKEIPNSMGAITISGLNNWVKINMGKLMNDPDFFYNKEHYQDSLIVLSHGFYSGLENIYTKYSQGEWLTISLQIRKYHELTHYLCRKKYYSLRNALLDEVFADCMGIIMAVGNYEDSLAMRFLGIEQEEYKKGMRLENYITDEEDIYQLAEKVRQFMHVLKEMTAQTSDDKAKFEYYIDCYYQRAASLFTEIFQ